MAIFAPNYKKDIEGLEDIEGGNEGRSGSNEAGEGSGVQVL